MVEVWGLPLAPLTFAQVLDAVDELIAARKPSVVVTANLNYAMLAADDAELARVTRAAALVVADGWPLVWAARRAGTPLPERVAGSDLLPALCGRAAARGHRVFLLGGAPGVADAAGQVLATHFPGLQLVGTESPPFGRPSPEGTAALLGRIRAAAPDLLFVALGQPKGELWLDAHLCGLGVPVGIQVGAAFDMLTGRVCRAPDWVQRRRLEWAWRIATEPRRLGPRYARNVAFLARKLLSRPPGR